MRNLFMLLVVVSVTFLAACRPVSAEQATTDFCADLQAYKDSVDNLGTLTADSTVDEAEAAMKEVSKARSNLNDSASILADVKVDAIDEAYDTMDKALRDINSSDTISDAVTIVQEQVANVSAAYDELYATNCK
jgi:hypothetical protein